MGLPRKSHQMMRAGFLLALCLAVLSLNAASASDWGILNLDNSTFPRLVDGSRTVFVRFDREYPYGEKHDAWKAMAAAVAGSNADVLVGNVGISTYGDKMNQDLAQKYGYKTAGKDLEYNDMDNFPKFNLFKKGAADKSVEYTGSVTQEDLIRFLKKEGGVHIGLQGTLQHFDELAAKFKDGDKDALLKEAEGKAAAEGADTKATAEMYVKVMKKIVDKPEFATTETKRL